MSVCNLCKAGPASACPLANRESEQTAPRDALLFGSWQCITYAVKCNIMQFALSDLVHPHCDACVQTVLPRACIYVSPGLLRGLSGCTMRCFRAWQLAMHHARRSSSSNLRGLMHPNDHVCQQSVPSRPCICRVLLPTERVNRLHHATLCCLGAGKASHSQINVTLSDSLSRA